MNRVPVISSSIRVIGYDRASRTLEVEFNHGAIYQYFEVPLVLYGDFMAASSMGPF